jgi:hypothetical protein
VPERFSKNAFHAIPVHSTTNVLFCYDETDTAEVNTGRQCENQKVLAGDFESSAIENGLEVRSAQ